ncbi:MAG: S-layer homology domain-containing protein [Actinobacteria bacterium]|nr:S-layer homology domain-containing protein [Actinomycetota bacterium]
MLISYPTMEAKSLKRAGLLVLGSLIILAGIALYPGGAQARSAAFSDVPSTSSYHVQIETLALLGIIDGYSDGTFRPNNTVTRQQFAKMVVLAMRIGVSESDVCAFRDVKKTGEGELYPDHYVAAAAREGIVTGYSTSSGLIFKPDSPITLAQLITMGTKSADRGLFVPPDSWKSAWGNFDPVHAVIARVAQYNGLLRDVAPAGRSLKSLSPWGNATRAEAAALLFNIMGTDTAGLNGRFLGDSTDLVRYFRAAGVGDGKFSVPLETLAKLYVKYGERFGIRADMAWAQMIHETGYGRYGGVVLPEQNNMAGIGATGPGVAGNSFATAELGVVAQFAHLAWYVYPDHLDDPYCAMVAQPADGPIATPGDPRHFLQPDGGPHKGNVRTLYDLSGKWAVGSDYGDAIKKKAAAITPTCGLW